MREIESKSEVDMSPFTISGSARSDTERQIEAAIESGYAYKPTGESMSCPCGYSGEPEVIVKTPSMEYSVFYCPNCGDA